MAMLVITRGIIQKEICDFWWFAQKQNSFWNDWNDAEWCTPEDMQFPWATRI